MSDLALRSRWLAAMRASTTRATGRECDYAMSEGDVDTFDAIGLLALAAGDAAPEFHTLASGWQTYSYMLPDSEGAHYARWAAERLAQQVGLSPTLLPELCQMNDEGVAWSEIADWVEGQCV